jgi:hypothetical protein
VERGVSQPAMIRRIRAAAKAAIKTQLVGTAADRSKELHEALCWIDGVSVSRAFDILTVRRGAGFEHRLRYGVLGYGPSEVLLTVQA